MQIHGYSIFMAIKTPTWLLHICKNKKLLLVFPLYLGIEILHSSHHDVTRPLPLAS